MAPHGTVSRYARGGCRCDACRTATADYMRSWRRRRREQGDHGGRGTWPGTPNLAFVDDYPGPDAERPPEGGRAESTKRRR